MIPASRRLKKNVKLITDDNEYLADLDKRKQYLQGITDSIDSPFGVILIKALETIESSALESLLKANFQYERSQAKAEVKVARFLKATIMGYSYEKEAFENAVQQYIEMESGDMNDNQI